MSGDASRWGWHQLDRRWATRLVELVDVVPGDLVLDVGAGAGAVTAQLLRAGATVVAIELHPRRVDLLRERFASRAVTVVRADATDLHLPRRPFKVVANPPFGATTAILRRLTHPSSRLQQASLVVPAWAARRWSGGRGAGGATSKRTFRCSLGPTVPPGAFRHAPPAAPAVLLIARRSP